MTEDRLVKLAAALCTGLMFGLLWAGGAPAIVFQLLGVGVSLMAGACVAAELPPSRTALLALLLALLAAGTPVAGAAERRVALVIGNADYREAPLANPRHDAYDVAAALGRLGFHVIVRTDADARAMRAALEEFGAQLRRGGVGLFYYAGHGLQLDGVNHLVPVDAQIEREADIAAMSVDANTVLRAMEDARVDVRILILDACRNNPFAQHVQAKTGARVLSVSGRDERRDPPGGGLAHMAATTGSLIAFATAPGSTAADGTGRNGTYTKHLLASLREDDSDILKVFQRTRAGVVSETGGRQTPWESTSLIRDFRFRQETPASRSLLPTVGDTWTYRVTDPRGRNTRHQVTVASVAPDAVFERTISGLGAGTPVRRGKGAYVARQSDVSLFSPYLLAFENYKAGGVIPAVEFFDPQTCQKAQLCQATAKVLGEEVVRVAAGEFQAVKVEVQQSWTGRGPTVDSGWRTLTLWYAPQAKRLVKASSRGSHVSTVACNFDLELESYELHGLPPLQAAPARDSFQFPATSSVNSSTNSETQKRFALSSPSIAAEVPAKPLEQGYANFQYPKSWPRNYYD